MGFSLFSYFFTTQKKKIKINQNQKSHVENPEGLRIVENISTWDEIKFINPL